MVNYRIDVVEDTSTGKFRAELFVSDEASEPAAKTPWRSTHTDAAAEMRRALVKLFPDIPKMIIEREDIPN